jgi:hypothetical protein
VLILDDCGLATFRDENRRDLLERLEDRHDRRATMVTSQLPIAHWHEAIGDPTLADAILDRLVHNAYKIALQGDSRRKRQAKVTHKASSEYRCGPWHRGALTGRQRCRESVAACSGRHREENTVSMRHRVSPASLGSRERSVARGAGPIAQLPPGKPKMGCGARGKL